ncbi:MAG TPA: hypothetical protein VGS60_02520 [Actinomycetes bacterium]|nr:hypothetical protein [Actinomycetes bacterium]
MMRVIERAIRGELRKMPDDVRGSALAKAAIDLAKRPDAGPADTAAVLLVRELRLTMTDLYRRVPEDLTNDVDRFLARIAAPDVGHATH